MIRWILIPVLCLGYILGGAVVIDENFQTKDNLLSVCEKETLLIGPPGKILLGGKGAHGEKAGFSVKTPFTVDSFSLLLEGIRWSHNNAVGGHPTEIAILDASNRGYIVELKGGNLTMSRQNEGGGRTELGRLDKLWNPGEGFTTARNFFFLRNADGELTVGFDQISRRLTVKDDAPLRNLSKLTVRYGVFVHGYAAELQRLVLRDDCVALPDSAGQSAPAAVRLLGKDAKIALVDPDPARHPICRTGEVSRLAEEMYRVSGKGVEILPASFSAESLAGVEQLLLPGECLTAENAGVVLDFLRKGKRMILWSPLPQSLFDAEKQDALHRFRERILGVVRRVPILTDSPVALTADGKAAGLGKALGNGTFSSLSLLPLNNSIEKQSLLPGVKRAVLATAEYSGKNWIQQPDRFLGAVIEETCHGDGEFAGAKVAYLGFSPASCPRAGELMVTLAESLNAFSPSALPPLPTLPDRPAVTRADFFERSGGTLGALCFRSYNYLGDPVFVEDLNGAGMDVVAYCIPWFYRRQDGEIVNWEQLDKIVSEVKAMGKTLILDPYPFNFNPKAFAWWRSVPYHPEFEDLYADALRRIAERYRNEPALVGMWVSSFTSGADFCVVDSPEVRKLWADYLRNVKKLTLPELEKRYQCKIEDWSRVPLPRDVPELRFNVGMIWNDYFDFHVYEYGDFLRKAIRAVREVIPEMPLMIRGTFMDPALNMSIAAEFPRVATHIECLETSTDTEGFYRSLKLGFHIPVTGENGWPKAAPAAMRHAIADYLMGEYAALTYSFDGPRWMRANFADFREAICLKTRMGKAVYPEPELGILLPDTTLHASRPANFFSIEKLPSLELTLERMNFPFSGVSCDFPRFNRLKVVISSGSTFVFTPELKRELADWIKAGGTFVTFPEMGEYCLDGSGPFLASQGLPKQPGEYALGKGRVVVLPELKPTDYAGLDRLFRRLGLKGPFVIDKPVCNAVFEDDSRKFLVLFDKQKIFTGSFFTESTLEAQLSTLKPVTLKIRPAFAFKKAWNERTGQELKIRNGVVSYVLPPTDYAVLKFE